jgi:GTP cyclohydrolase II
MMNGPGQCVSQFRDDAPAELPEAPQRALRAVHRAASELRRGTPVLLSGPEGALILAAAETVSARALVEMARGTHAAPVLLLAPVRAAAVLQRPVPQSAQPATAPLRM